MPINFAKNNIVLTKKIFKIFKKFPPVHLPEESYNCSCVTSFNERKLYKLVHSRHSHSLTSRKDSAVLSVFKKYYQKMKMSTFKYECDNISKTLH